MASSARRAMTAAVPRSSARNAAPFVDTRGFFTGDYESMAIDRDGKLFHTSFTSTNCDDPNCTAPGNPVGALVESKAPPDPIDVYMNQYYKAS